MYLITNREKSSAKRSTLILDNIGQYWMTRQRRISTDSTSSSGFILTSPYLVFTDGQYRANKFYCPSRYFKN